MTEGSGRRQSIVAVGALASLVLCSSEACRRPAGSLDQPASATLRIGVSVGQMAAADPQNGLRQVSQNQSVEGLVKIGEDGRPTAWLAQNWEYTPDGRTLKVHLRPGLTFHDGSPVTASVVAKAIETLLSNFMGPAFADVERISASGPRDLDIALRQPSPFVLEALELQFRSPAPNSAGTGPFEPVGPKSPTELRANEHYYLGRPIIDRLAVNTYPTARAAWAEMLRDHLDMLYEVGTDALDSLERSNQILVFTYLRHYQYSLIFNTHQPTLRSAAVRRALSEAIDRDAVVRDALNGHGVASSGPIWPRHWAVGSDLEKFPYDPGKAAKNLPPSRLHFTCLVPPDYERIALVVKRQLDRVNVSMDIKELPPDRILDAMTRRDFDAVLFDLISGPSLFRQFFLWRSGTSGNLAGFSSAVVDAALDRIRHSSSDDDYRAGVVAFQHSTMEDPPAIFLAWSERARAVSKRFVVTDAQPGRDILSTLRFWKPAVDEGPSSRN
jgi:peptide/nickel transport system substrate-binding protein